MASAAPQFGGPLGSPLIDNGPAVYNYAYSVADDLTGTHFGKNEVRDGPHTEGEYHVALPDGRIQTVTYHVDGDSGYIADVNYSGQSNIGVGVGSRLAHSGIVHSPIAHGLAHPAVALAHSGLGHPVSSRIALANSVAAHNNIAVNSNLAHNAAIARSQRPLFG